MSIRHILEGAIAVSLIVLFAAAETSAYPDGRRIYVNGERMSTSQVAIFDDLNCGQPIPSGRYWVDWNTGIWGYAGGPAQGYIVRDDCEQQRPAPRSSGQSRRQGYWEDRMFQRGLSDDVIHMPIYPTYK